MRHNWEHPQSKIPWEALGGAVSVQPGNDQLMPGREQQLS